MANKEHAARLKQGVKAWNRWRDEKPDIALDLHETNLLRANLFEVSLTRAKLNQANLTGALILEKTSQEQISQDTPSKGFRLRM